MFKKDDVVVFKGREGIICKISAKNAHVIFFDDHSEACILKDVLVKSSREISLFEKIKLLEDRK